MSDKTLYSDIGHDFYSITAGATRNDDAETVDVLVPEEVINPIVNLIKPIANNVQKPLSEKNNINYYVAINQPGHDANLLYDFENRIYYLHGLSLYYPLIDMELLREKHKGKHLMELFKIESDLSSSLIRSINYRKVISSLDKWLKLHQVFDLGKLKILSTDFYIPGKILTYFESILDLRIVLDQSTKPYPDVDAIIQLLKSRISSDKPLKIETYVTNKDEEKISRFCRFTGTPFQIKKTNSHANCSTIVIKYLPEEYDKEIKKHHNRRVPIMELPNIISQEEV